ncbi:hypothetical protein HDU76_003773 [Blyttiomyces sp. JEL0837]|nr:hypothetical protein HDU76_003773 [Blyttiomyces sp. JEL0837]
MEKLLGVSPISGGGQLTTATADFDFEKLFGISFNDFNSNLGDGTSEIASTGRASSGSASASPPTFTFDDIINSAIGGGHEVATKGKRGRKRKELTAEEMEEKMRERLVRNRVAAQTSRNRKRQYIDQLEETNAQLTDRISVLEDNNRDLVSRMEEMAKQLSDMRALMKLPDSAGTRRLLAISSGMDSGLPSGVSLGIMNQSRQSTARWDSSRAAAAASAASLPALFKSLSVSDRPRPGPWKTSDSLFPHLSFQKKTSFSFANFIKKM